MSDTSGTQAAPTTEQKPPTLADIVREKTDDGRRIVDFFLDVMEGRIDGAELCHRMDAAKQLEKHKSRAAARFIARYRGVACGHAIRGPRTPADPCSGAEGSPATEPLDASSPFSQHILSVLSAVDNALLAKLVREQTGDGSTVIQFLDDGMHGSLPGFRCHHKIAAAKELIVHIARDEAPASVPAEAPTSVRAERVEAPKHEWPTSILWPEEYKFIHSRALENPREILARAENDPAHPLHGYFKDYDDVRASIESVGGFLDPDGLLTSHAPTQTVTQTVIPAEAGTQRGGAGRGSHPIPLLTAHPEPGEAPEANSPVIPAEAGTHPLHPEPGEAPEASSPVIPAEAGTHPLHPRRRSRRSRRQEGEARARMRRNPARNRPHYEQEDHERKEQSKKTVGEPIPNLWERRMKKRLEEHWHAPDPFAASGRIDSTSPSRSPPW